MTGGAPQDNDHAARRRAMVDWQLRRRGIRNEAVLKAMEEVPRHLFVPPRLQAAAYDDSPLYIGHGQTISQPYMVARMTELLEVSPGSRVLEIGTGSGYQAAVLAHMGAEVWTVERIPELAEKAKAILTELGYTQVHIRVGDGTAGWPEYAPYDGIVVTAAAPYVPDPLVEQLAENGRLVIPVGGRDIQQLRVVRKAAGGTKEHFVLDCRFVPLVGEYGYNDPEESTP